MSPGDRDLRRLRRKTLAGVVLTVTAVAFVVGLVWWFRAREAGPARSGPSHRAVRQEIDAEASTRLSRYGWVDRDQGVVRIPLERAVELILRERAAEERRGG